MRFISVDLPEPDGPMIATYSLGSIVKLTPRRAWISSAPICRCATGPRRGSGRHPAAAPGSALMSSCSFFSRP